MHSIRRNVLPALMLSFTFCVFGPTQLYITNKREFWFSFADVWWPCILVGLSVLAICAGIGCLFSGKWQEWYNCLVLGIALAFYIQGNYIATDYGVLDGNAIDWSQYKEKMALNVVLWSVCIVLPFVLRKIIRKKYSAIQNGIAAFIIAVQGITLLVLLIGADLSSGGESTYVSTKNLNKVSLHENIVVFVLDTFDQEYFQEILDTDPNFTRALDGFTFFENNTGMYPTTKGALPFILTGSPCLNEQPYSEYIDEAYRATDFYRDLQDNGWEIGIYTENIYLQSSACWNYVSNLVDATPIVSSHVGLMGSFYKLTAFRYMPQLVKPLFEIYSGEFDTYKMAKVADEELNIFSQANQDYFTYEKDHPLVGQEEKTYRFIHILGAHPPYTLDENVSLSDDATAITQSKASLSIVYEYIDQLRNLGVYENTTIIVMADHGETGTGEPTNPLFLVKRKGDVGALKMSHSPVSQTDIQATIMEEAGLNLDGKYGRSAFEYREDEKRIRQFIYYNWERDGSWSEDVLPPLTFYRVEAGGNGAEFYRMEESTDALRYSLGTTLLFGDSGDIAAPYFIKGLSAPEGDTTWSLGKESVFSFRPDGYKGGDLQVDLSISYTLGVQELVVSVSEQEAFSEMIDGKCDVSFSIPAELIGESVDIKFSYPAATSPQELGISEDARVLALSFESMCIRES